MLDPWPAIEILASEILTMFANLSYRLFLTPAVIAAHLAIPVHAKSNSGEGYCSLKWEAELLSVCPSYFRGTAFSLHSHLHLQLKADYSIWETPCSSLCCPVQSAG